MSEDYVTAMHEDVFRMMRQLEGMKARLESEAEQMWLALDRFVTKTT